MQDDQNAPQISMQPRARKAKKPRKGEQLGGGWFVFARCADGRIHPSPFPFEHPTLAAAEAEAQRLADKKPRRTFHVVGIVATMHTAFVSVPGAPEHERRASHSRNAADPGAVLPSSSRGCAGVSGIGAV